VTDPDITARNRYFLMTASRLAGVAGALLGLVLIGRGVAAEQKAIGVALVLSAMVVMAVVPRALARRWRTPPEA
jgi:drug/metabolite transporter (DMT)-like permease